MKFMQSNLFGVLNKFKNRVSCDQKHWKASGLTWERLLRQEKKLNGIRDVSWYWRDCPKFSEDACIPEFFPKDKLSCEFHIFLNFAKNLHIKGNQSQKTS